MVDDSSSPDGSTGLTNPSAEPVPANPPQIDGRSRRATLMNWVRKAMPDKGGAVITCLITSLATIIATHAQSCNQTKLMVMQMEFQRDQMGKQHELTLTQQSDAAHNQLNIWVAQQKVLEVLKAKEHKLERAQEDYDNKRKLLAEIRKDLLDARESRGPYAEEIFIAKILQFADDAKVTDLGISAENMNVVQAELRSTGTTYRENLKRLKLDLQVVGDLFGENVETAARPIETSIGTDNAWDVEIQETPEFKTQVEEMLNDKKPDAHSYAKLLPLVNQFVADDEKMGPFHRCDTVLDAVVQQTRDAERLATDLALQLEN